jgi:hypothetical protein
VVEVGAEVPRIVSPPAGIASSSSGSVRARALGSSAEASGAGDAIGGSGDEANGSRSGLVKRSSCRESSESDDAMDGLITCRTRQEAGPTTVGVSYCLD